MVQTQIDATVKVVQRDLNGRLGLLGRERRLGDKAEAKRKQDSRKTCWDCRGPSISLAAATRTVNNCNSRERLSS